MTETTSPVWKKASQRTLRLADRFSGAALATGGLLLFPQLLVGGYLLLPDGEGERPAASAAKDGPAELTFVVTGDRSTAKVSYTAPAGPGARRTPPSRSAGRSASGRGTPCG